MSEIRYQSSIINFLLAHRVLRTHVNKGMSFHEREKELAERMLVSSISFRRDLDEYLAETGFRIITKEASQTAGLPTGATHFLLIRDVEENVPEWLSPNNVYPQLALKDNEAKNTTRTWFFFIWTNMLILLYSMRNRQIGNISDYLKANFAKENLVGQIRETIEEARLNPSDDKCKVILAEQGQEIERRVGRFLTFMGTINYLSKEKESDEAYYVQTLLMAVELAENYHLGLGYRFNESSSPIENVKDNLYETSEVDNVLID